MNEPSPKSPPQAWEKTAWAASAVLTGWALGRGKPLGIMAGLAAAAGLHALSKDGRPNSLGQATADPTPCSPATDESPGEPEAGFALDPFPVAPSAWSPPPAPASPAPIFVGSAAGTASSTARRPGSLEDPANLDQLGQPYSADFAPKSENWEKVAMTLAEAVKALAVGPMRYPTATVLPPLPAITIQASPVTTPAKLTRAEAPPPSHDEESTALKVEKATSQPFIWEHNQEVHSISEAWGETVWFGLHELAQPSIREVAATTEPRALAPKPPSQPPQEAGDLTELPPALPPQAPPQKIEAAPQATHATEPGPRKEPELSFAPGLAPASFALISPFTLAPQPQAESEPEPEVLTPLPGVSVPHVAPPTREQIPLPPPVSLFEFTNEIAAPFPPPRIPAPPPAPQAEAVPTPVLAPDSSALAALMSALQAKSSEPASPPPIPESTVERGLFPSPFVMEPSEFEEAAPCIHESPSPLDELLSRPHPPLPHPSLQPVHFVDELLAKPVAAPGLPHPRTDGVPPRTLIEGLSRSRGQFSSPPPPDPHLKSSPEERPLPPVTRFAPLSPQTTANLDDHRPSRFRWSMAVFGTLLLLAVVAMFLHLYTGGAVWEKRRWQEWLMMEPHTPGTVEHPALPAETSPQLTQSTP